MSHPTKGRGVLPINAAATRKPNKSSPRVPAPKLRLIIRRLPPGLKQAEFWDALGPEWQVGGGKVDWAAFKQGKISKDLAKPSRPARAYLKVKEQNLLDSLSSKVRQTNFQDAKNTSKDLCLLGPPLLEFAPYNKIPSGRARNDGRQGTIDQDPEFIDFLQRLTEPIVRPSTNGAEGGELKDKKVITTPLVQFIKDKKANKAKEKEAAATKASKKGQENKEGKVAASTKSEPRSKIVKSTTANSEKAKVQKATEDAVKAANRFAASAQTKAAAAKSGPKSPAKETASPAQNVPKRERQRGDASVAARMVARDLGLTPKENKSGRAAKATSKPPESPTTPTTSQTPTSIPSALAPDTSKAATAVTQTAPSATQAPTGPRNARQSQQQPKQPAQAGSQKPPKAAPQPSTDAKSAFLKHANPSQGVTEDLLRDTFGVYGVITRCEIDKKKGLGYIDFTEPEGLKKAMAASPVKVGSGQVVVLENRSPYKKSGQQQREGKNAKGSATVNSPVLSAASSPKPAEAKIEPTKQMASIIEQTTNATSTPTVAVTPDADPSPEDSAAATTSPSAPPSAPKGARSGRSNHRGGRGGHRGRGKGGGGRGGANSSQTQQTAQGATNASTGSATTEHA